MNDKKKGSFSTLFDGASSIISTISNVIDIIKNKSTLVKILATLLAGGTWLAAKWNSSTLAEKVLVFLLMIVLVLMIIGWSCFIGLRKKRKAEVTGLTQENAKLAGESQKLNDKITELERKNLDLEQKLEQEDQKICRFREKADILEKALRSKIPPQVGFYVTNKKSYDDFKMNLLLLECTLEVRLPKPDPPQSERNMHFRWTLVVKNDQMKPSKAVHFIFSGEKRLHPKVFIKEGNREKRVNVSVKLKEPTGDDCFIEIKLPNPIKCGATATIIVDYIPRAYQFRRSCDSIWLAPDALGFASVSEFCIRVFHDHDVIVPETTNCILRTYQSCGSYSAEDDQLIFPSEVGEETVFQCSGRDEDDNNIQNHAYLLVLINDYKTLPPYLHDMRTQCERQQS